MDKQERVNGHAAKTRREAGATPPCRKITARSLRASGSLPPRAAENAARVLAAVHATDREFVRHEV